mgnify:CR=1 FL=1|jgi:hypothetical protein
MIDTDSTHADVKSNTIKIDSSESSISNIFTSTITGTA